MQNNAKLNSIQALRGIAASLVVIFHAQMLMQTYETRYGIGSSLLNSNKQTLLFGSCGVDIFFAISGFIMAYITYEKFGSTRNIFPFLQSRFLRIVPIYWFYTSIIGVLLLFTPQLFTRASFDLRSLVLSYLFIPYTPVGENLAPVLAVGWTLVLEMYFYLIVAIGLFLSRTKFVISCGLLFAFSVFIPEPQSNPIAQTLSSPFLLEFYLGLLVGITYKSKLYIPQNVALVMIALAVISFLAWFLGIIDAHRVISWGVPAALLVAGSVFLEKNLLINFPSALLKLGDSSYTLYLSHYLLLPGFGKLCASLKILHYINPTVIVFMLYFACAFSGYLLYLTIELPITRYFRKKATKTYYHTPEVSPVEP